MAHRFLERLARGPILADGAMGTMLYSRGVSFDRSFDELNASRPDLVEQIHREYIVAGAEIIETNTFGANRVRLAQHGLEGRVRELNNRGVRLAREAREITGESVFVAGSVGPIGQSLQPLGSLSLYDARQAFSEQIEALLERGVDLFVLETFTDLSEIVEAILAVRAATDLPIVAQMSFGDDRRLDSGMSASIVARSLALAGADVVGLNCGVGPQAALDVVREMRSASSVPIAAQPNAGSPALVGGRTVYVATPDYFGDLARSFVAEGASLIGGCCGTTPEFIRAMRLGLAADPSEADRPRVVAVAAPEPLAIEESERDDPHTLAAKLKRGDFIVSVEIDPPRGLNPRKAIEGAITLRDAGVDCINIGDSPMATVRMSASGMALLVRRDAGVEPIIHCTPRDRNLMALQSDLLGAHANGIRNVIAVTGDPPRIDSSPRSTTVWDVDSIGLIALLKRFNQGIDAAGKSIGRRAAFTVGCAVTPTADDIDREVDRLRQKIEAGADFVLSQPLWSIEQLLAFEERVGRLPVPHILGILPLESSKHAELLHNEVPGMTVPPEVRERMRRAGERGREVGLEITEELIQQARGRVQGVYIITSYGRYDAAVDLVTSLKAAVGSTD
ncbi:MAG: bifunctional homocysteine S-methyltransferase/methylenetetrahydrofolate reductase [Chloroflexota bacterium]|nr:MAG: bifunctional homocysteine S-methyltransferase/methylenetetrahydrofolate reductase [Chloroflexota bacterium]